MQVRFLTKQPSYFMAPMGRGGWYSDEPWHIYSERLGFSFVIPAMSRNDLASIPRIFRSFFPVNSTHRPAAVVHDYLYQMKGKLPEGNITRKQADGVFKDLMKLDRRIMFNAFSEKMQVRIAIDTPRLYQRMISDGPLVNVLKRNIMYRAVRSGGWTYWRG